MKVNKRPAIDRFLAAKKIAVIGVSRNPDKTGSMFLKELVAKGLAVVGVTPHLEEFAGQPCYPSVSDLPSDVDAVLTVVPPASAMEAVRAAHAKGITNVWMQLGSQSAEAVNFATENGMNLVTGECFFMYCEPVVSFHKFHRSINKLFGQYHRALT